MGRSWTGIVLCFLLTLAGCGDNARSPEPPRDPCGGCAFGEFCNVDTLVCEGSGSADMGVDVHRDAQGDRGHDDTGVGDLDPDRGLQDRGLEDPEFDESGVEEPGTDPDADVDFETHVDPDFDADMDFDPDAGDPACVDRFEPDEIWHSAAHLHDELLVAQLGECTGDTWDNCGLPCEIDAGECTTLTRSLCGCCECTQFDDLVLCGGDDRDNFTFTVLQGDSVSIRIIPLWDTRPALYREQFMIFVWQPPDDHRRDDPWPPDGTSVRAEWDATGSFLEANIGSGYVGEDVVGVLATYTLTLNPTNTEMEPFEYELWFQVEDTSRGCPGDSWDKPWESYATDDPTETSCSAATDCVLTHSIEKDGTICPWDHSDVFRISLAGAGTHKVRISHQDGAPALIAEVRTTGGDLVQEICPSSGGCRQPTYFEDTVSFGDGDYLIHVAGDGDYSHNSYSVEVLNP